MSAVLALYFGLVSLFCILTGLSHPGQKGAWLPVVTGLALLCLILGLFLVVTRRLWSLFKEKNSVQI